VQVKVAAVKGLFILDMMDAPDVPNGGTEAVVGFGIEDMNGDPVTNSMLIELGVFLDQNATQVALDKVQLKDASVGTILAGEGGPAIKVLTNDDGEFSCTLVCDPRDTVYVAANSTFGGPFVNCSEVDAITFKPVGVE